MVDEQKEVAQTKSPTDAPSEKKVLTEYTTVVRNIKVHVSVETAHGSYTPLYSVSISGLSRTTEAILEVVREELIKLMDLQNLEVDEKTGETSEKFEGVISSLIAQYFPFENEQTTAVLRGYLISRALGMGYVDFLLEDPHLEEIAIDNSDDPIWVYHRQFGWLQSNIYMSNEEQIKQTASRIGRNVGRQINTLNPLLDAYLSSGERVNATISPITPKGNTITLRKFSDDPWTITKFIENKTLSAEIGAFLWQVIQYEMSVLVVGGTASGKTSMLNALANFISPNQRIISIEDTRELRLASYLYWVPMMTRLANSEGKGAVNMEDLLVNSLRMRPDRIVVGEVRRKAEAETLFEAIHTGHSCYGTFHANNAHEAIARLTNDPVSVPKALLPAINLLLVQFRNRRTGMRRSFEIAEVTEDCDHNLLYQYDMKKDVLVKKNKSKKLLGDLSLFTGMSEAEIFADIDEKKWILDTLVKNKVFNVEEVGKIMADYYANKPALIKRLKQPPKPKKAVVKKPVVKSAAPSTSSSEGKTSLAIKEKSEEVQK